jgi:hypothetical protein
MKQWQMKAARSLPEAALHSSSCPPSFILLGSLSAGWISTLSRSLSRRLQTNPNMIRLRSKRVGQASIACCAFALLFRRTKAFHPSACSPSHPLHRNSPPNQTIPQPSQFFSSSTHLKAAPKRGSVVDTYQTVSVNCNSCRTRLFRYKKKNGTKSNLIKCYIERIVEAEDESLQRDVDNFANLDDGYSWCCPSCGVNFARCAMIRGLPALKLVGGKTRMTKK